MPTKDQIICPNCATVIDVNAVLYQQLELEFKQQLTKQLTEQFNTEKNRLNSEVARLQTVQQQFEIEKANYQKSLNEQMSKAIADKELQLTQTIKSNIEKEQQEIFAKLQSELNSKNVELKELQQTRLQVEQLKREKDNLAVSIQIEMEKKLTAELSKNRELIAKQEFEKNQFKLLEKENLIAQLSNQLKDAQRKVEQGSNQVQGEVQELAIEQYLSQLFPLDEIVEIKKGSRGADCLQIVHDRTMRDCGKIYYESKRTKAFQPDWIEKFKLDMREKNVQIGVLVTEVMPKELPKMGFYQGIWICSFAEFQSLVIILRHNIIEIAQLLQAKDNQGDKMSLLYEYLTGYEFRSQIEAIVEGFTQLQTDLDSEKRAMQSIWKKREKQIHKVLQNTNYMYSSIKGIAGSAILPVAALELDSIGAIEQLESIGVADAVAIDAIDFEAAEPADVSKELDENEFI